jgi:DHA1 family tetracycline resistance protein-like MFS transporter
MDRKKLFPILLIVFTNILGAGVILPILPLYAEGQFGGTILQVTLLSTSFFAAQFLAAPWLGRLSDRYGRRPVLIVSQIGTVLAFMLFIFAGPLGSIIDAWGLALPMSGGMIMLYVARTLDGITGGNITTAQAYVTDVTPEENRAQGLGLVQAAFGVGFIFGPAFGGVLSNLGPVAPFVGATLITIGTLLLTVFTLEESLPPEARVGDQPGDQPRPSIPLSELLSWSPLRVILAIGFFASLAFAALPATFALYADRVLFPDLAVPGRAQLYIGLMLTFNGLMQVVTQLALLKPLVSRLGERKLLLLGMGALLVAAIGVASAESAIVVTLLFAPFAFGRGVTEPSLQSLTTRFGDRRTRGQLLGIYQSARSLALIFGPVWAGYAFEAISPRAVFWITGGLILVALALSAVLLTQSLPPLRARARPEAASGD